MLKPNECRPKLVHITWTDSSIADTGWGYLDGMEPLPPTRVESVGWLIDETHDYITIAGGLADTQVLGRMTIPKVAIIEPVTRLAAIRPKRKKT